MSNLEGVMLSDYLLLQRVSKGAIADVYRARPTSEGNYEVAVKVFHLAQHTTLRDRFMAEAEKIGRFDHPNILPLLEFGEGEDLLYTVTPYVISGTLEDLLTRVGGKFSAMQTLPIMQQLCSAVQYAHIHDVVHGNIKARNVCMAGDGRMLLSDFGSPCKHDDGPQSLTNADWSAAEYAAPEQALGLLRPPSDIYSLGVLLFRILTGTLPFSGQTPVEVLLKHVREQPPSARSSVPTISDAVEGVLEMALQKRADDRFVSAEELSNALLAAVTIAPVASPVTPSVTTRPLQHTPAQLVHLGNLQTAHSAEDLPMSLPVPYVMTPAASLARKTTPLPMADTDETYQPMPLIPIRNGGRLTLSALDDQEQQPPFSSDQMRIGKHRFWSVDANPVEWSPVTSTPIASVPLTADTYLRTKPVASVELPPAPELLLPTRVEKLNTVNARSFSRTFHKALPIIVVILLLLGLLGALLSSFYFSSDNHGAYTRPEYAIAGIALITPLDEALPHMSYSHR